MLCSIHGFGDGFGLSSVILRGNNNGFVLLNEDFLSLLPCVHTSAYVPVRMNRTEQK